MTWIIQLPLRVNFVFLGMFKFNPQRHKNNPASRSTLDTTNKYILPNFFFKMLKRSDYEIVKYEMEQSKIKIVILTLIILCIVFGTLFSASKLTRKNALLKEFMCNHSTVHRHFQGTI